MITVSLMATMIITPVHPADVTSRKNTIANLSMFCLGKAVLRQMLLAVQHDHPASG